MEKIIDEINEIKEVLETKELTSEEVEKLQVYLDELETKRERMEGKKVPEKIISMDEVVRNKRRMDNKYKRKERRLPSTDKPVTIENKRLANKVIRHEEDFSTKGKTYKKFYDEPSEPDLA